MLKIRLSRVGKKKRPSYRVVVADVRARRDGAFVEIIGHYNPLTDPATIVIDEERALNWLRQGARPTERVAILMTRLGILEKPTRKHTERLAGELEEKPAEKPAGKKPAKEVTAAEKPAEKEPVAEQPAKEVTATEEPAEEEPGTEISAEEVTATEKPAAEEPATEEPAEDKNSEEEPAGDETTAKGEG